MSRAMLSAAGHRLPSVPMVAKARDVQWFGVPFRDRKGPDADGWQEATVHASALHVGRSAVALGGVAWRCVRHMAAEAEDGKLLSAKAVFRHLGGKHSSPERLLLDQGSLSAAYAGLLTNRPLQLRWQEKSSADGQEADEDRLPDAVCAARAYVYSLHQRSRQEVCEARKLLIVGAAPVV